MEISIEFEHLDMYRIPLKIHMMIINRKRIALPMYSVVHMQRSKHTHVANDQNAQHSKCWEKGKKGKRVTVCLG